MLPNCHFVCATGFSESLETVAKGYRQTKRTASDERRMRSQLVLKGDWLLECDGAGARLGCGGAIIGSIVAADAN